MPLVELVAARMSETLDPKKDVVFIVRTGALFPVYRTFSLLEQLKGRVVVPIFVGKARRYNRRFLQMCSHHLIEPVACTPASGWEKGLLTR